jgi:hypothetical protein
MSMATKQTRLVVLFDHEVRAAAKAIVEAIEASRVAGDSKDEEAGKIAGDRIWTALGLCQVALAGAEDDEALMTLASASAFRLDKPNG